MGELCMESSRAIPESEYTPLSGLVIAMQTPLRTALHSPFTAAANVPHQSALLYLLAAAMCLLLALALMKRVLTAIGMLAHAVAEAAVVAAATGIALVLLAAALIAL
jgi:hypothetical protein